MPIRSASRWMPWEAISGPQSLSAAPNCRSFGIQISKSSLFGDRAKVEPLLAAKPALARVAKHRAHRRRGQNGRQAEPGAAPWTLEVLDVARDRRGQEGRGRRRGVRRQYRRADGDGAVQSQDHGGDRSAGHRGALADAQGRVHRARCRSLDRRRRGASGQPRGHGQRHGARPVRSRAADGGAAQHRGRKRSRDSSEVREAGQILREEQLPHIEYRRASSKATTSARARSMWWSRKGSPATSRSRPRRGPPARWPAICKQRDDAHLARQARLSVRARGASIRCATRWIRANPMAAYFSASTAIVIKSHGGTDAGGLRRGDRSGLRHGALRTAREDRRDASPPCAATSTAADDERSNLVSMLRSVVLGCGSYLAGAGAQQRRACAHRRHHRTNGSCSAPASASATSRRPAK